MFSGRRARVRYGSRHSAYRTAVVAAPARIRRGVPCTGSFLSPMVVCQSPGFFLHSSGIRFLGGQEPRELGHELRSQIFKLLQPFVLRDGVGVCVHPFAQLGEHPHAVRAGSIGRGGAGLQASWHLGDGQQVGCTWTPGPISRPARASGTAPVSRAAITRLTPTLASTTRATWSFHRASMRPVAEGRMGCSN